MLLTLRIFLRDRGPVHRHCVEMNRNILEKEIPTKLAALELKQSSPPSQVNFIMNPLILPFATQRAHACHWLLPRMLAPLLELSLRSSVPTLVLSLALVSPSLILKTIAHKIRSASLETSISIQEKQFFCSTSICVPGTCTRKDNAVRPWSRDVSAGTTTQRPSQCGLESKS